MGGTDGSTVGSMLLWCTAEFDEDEVVMFWLNVYRGFREIEGTTDRYRFLALRQPDTSGGAVDAGGG
jgi:hypothetical protein